MDYEFRMQLNVDGNKYQCDVGFNIVHKGTIFALIEDDYMTDPDGMRPAVKQEYVERLDVDELPTFEVDYLSVYDQSPDDATTPEEVDAYFVMHPGTKDQVMDAVERYCETSLVDDVMHNGAEPTAAYYVHTIE